MTTPIKPNGSPGPVGHAPTAQRLPVSGESSKAHPAPGGYYERPGQTPTPRLETWQDQHAVAVEENDQRRREMARAVGMDPADSWAAIRARASGIYQEWRRLTDAAAAFEACLKGLPSHVHTRPVCAVRQCDCHPKKDGLCAKHYLAATKAKPQKGGE